MSFSPWSMSREQGVIGESGGGLGASSGVRRMSTEIDTKDSGSGLTSAPSSSSGKRMRSLVSNTLT